MKTKAILNKLNFYAVSSLLLSGLIASCGSLNNTTSLAEYDGIYDDDLTYVNPAAEVAIKEVEPNYFSLEYDRLSAYENTDYFTDIEGYTTPYDETYSEADSLPGNYTISEPWGHESSQTISVNVYNTRGFMYANPYYNGFYQFGFWGYDPYFSQYWGGGIYPPRYWGGRYYPPYYRPPYWGGGIYPPYYRPPYYGGGYYRPNYRPYYRNNGNYYYGKRGTTRSTNNRMSYTADYRKRSSYAKNSKTSRNQTRKSSSSSKRRSYKSSDSRYNSNSRTRDYNNSNKRSPSRNYNSPSYSSPRTSPSPNRSYSPRRSGGSSSRGAGSPRGGGVRRGGGRQSAAFTPSKSNTKTYRSKTTVARTSYSKTSNRTTVSKRKSKY